jgi:hypothetical protein
MANNLTIPTVPAGAAAPPAVARPQPYNHLNAPADSARLMALDAVKRGTPLARVNADMVEAGYEPIADPSFAPPPDPNASDVVSPGAKAADFIMPNLADAGETVSDAELAQRSKTAAGYLEAGEFSREVGSTLALNIQRAASTFAAATPAAIEARSASPEWAQYEQRELGMLQRIYGERTPTVIGQAQRMLEYIEARQPGAKAFLIRSGGGSSAAVLKALSDNYEKIAARRKP